jgi:hypothetical protein
MHDTLCPFAQHSTLPCTVGSLIVSDGDRAMHKHNEDTYRDLVVVAEQQIHSADSLLEAVVWLAPTVPRHKV